MDYDLALKKPFTSFKKLIIGILLSILPIVRWFAFGYILECSALGRNKTNNLPEWTNWKELFVKGFLATVIQLIYYIPAIIVLLIFGATALFALIKTLLTTELWQAVISGASEETIQSLIQPNLPLLTPYIVALAPFLVIAGILGLLAKYITPIAVLNYVKNNKFEYGFKGIVFKKAFTGKYFLAWLIIVVISLVISSILGYAIIIGPAIAFFIMGVFSYTLFGQVYLELEENLKVKEKTVKKVIKRK